MIDTFIFDIGNVLLDFDYKKVYRELFDEATAQAVTDSTLGTIETWLELDKGVLSYEEALSLIVSNAPHLEQEIRHAVKVLYETVMPYPYAESFLRNLKEKGYRIYILSNYGEQPFAATLPRMDFLKYVDGQLISYEIKHTKPERIIYQTLCERFQIVPENAVFLDDSPVNIAGAKAFGLNTILFTGYGSALAELSAMPLAYGL